MLHKESSTKIYFTREYSRFRNIIGNREVDKKRIKNIAKDILSGLDILRYVPILVIEKGEFLDIIDGQHRFEDSVMTKSHVWYILVEDLTIDDVAKINSNTANWKTKDFINCHIQRGNKNYVILDCFMKETGFALSIATRLLSKGAINTDGGQGATKSTIFKKGDFKVKEEEKARKFFQLVNLFSKFKYWQSGHFLLALEIIIKNEKCDYLELVEKFNNNPQEL